MDPGPPDHEPREHSPQSIGRRPGLSRVVAQLWRAQSALTVQDLLDLAQAPSPDTRLSKIYDWYFERSMSTLKLAFGAAGASFAALVGLLFTPDSATASRLLFVAIAVSSLAGVFQLRLVAQLQREFAESLRLMARMRDRMGPNDAGTR